MFAKRAIGSFGFIVLSLLGAGEVVATDDRVETFKLEDPNVYEKAYYGQAVSVSGQTALVGAYRDGVNGPSSGSVYVYDVTTGQELLKLTASDGAPEGYFGHSVALSGTTAIVGAYGNADVGVRTGAAYLFDVTTGQELFKLTASDASADDRFGLSVAICGNTAIVGAPYEDGAGDRRGAAYVFDVTTGQELFKLTASDATDVDFYGFSVAISEEWAVVSAHLHDEGTWETGSVYVYDLATQEERFELTSSDSAGGDYFGHSVSISGNKALMGAWQDDDDGTSSGSAYVFDVSTGQELLKLTASDAAAGDSFGYRVAIAGNVAVVGSHRDDDGGTSSGSAYVFDATTGGEMFKLTASDAAYGDYFGYSVAVGGTTALVGAYADEDYRGSAYLFDLPLPDTIPPGTVTDLHALNHTPGVWDDFARVHLTWAPASDDDSGIDGYSVLFDQSPSTDAPQTKVIEETSTIYSQVVPTSNQGHYFHIRAVDNAGNWGATVHAGPYFIDALPPEPVTDLESTSHATGAWSRDRSLGLEWSAATDAHSGIAGYGISVSTVPQLPGEEQDLNAVTSTQVTLNDGASWYFNIRSLDAVGNWDDDSVSIGPFRIDTAAPIDGTIDINSGAASTTSLTVSLNGLAASDPLSGLDRMQFSNNGSTWSPQESFASSRTSWDLSADGGDTAPGTKTVYVRYLDAVGNVSPAFSDYIEYIGSPKIESLTPRKGPLAGGNTVTVRGTGFTPDAAVYFGGESDAEVTFISSTELRVVVPPGPPLSPPSGNGNAIRLGVAVDVELYTAYGSDTKAKGYVYGFKR